MAILAGSLMLPTLLSSRPMLHSSECIPRKPLIRFASIHRGEPPIPADDLGTTHLSQLSILGNATPWIVDRLNC
jgi:hypothetical protein